ncbi:hypothetical protein [Actinokineospora terrae]|uniref:Uncharacterized protein n=1 Tax=Actinokineospora terrae TaxID=155974 RepID=A0A1H9WPM6_9PSEU|nr:hypothetical protein [Actinokineospora terrae]SES35739.1 hypothetical protein SAMN04487818_11143 [Actinokineospora terrae]
MGGRRGRLVRRRSRSGKVWFELDQGKADNPIIRVFTAFASIDPRQVGTAVTKGTLVEAKRDYLDGQELAKYTLDIDATALPPDVFGMPIGDYETETDKVKTEVWVGPGGKLARFQARVDAPGVEDVVVKVDYHHWGDAVNVQAPPPGEVEAISP